jgi:AcrR family transcriptional regulator
MNNNNINPMSPRTEEQYEIIRKEKREIIKGAALELFANEGFHQTSIAKIARKAAISKGLLYNYFDSKEQLLSELFHDIMQRIIDLLDPNHDEQITPEEAEHFFDEFFKTLVDNPKEWRLFYQLTMQKDVMDFLMKESTQSKIQSNQQIILNYFVKQNFNDPELAIIMFSSIFKGFTLMYAFAPEMFSDDLLERFKQKIKDIFIHRNVKPSDKEMEINDKLGYYLL